MTGRTSRRRAKLTRSPVQITPELLAFAREHYPVESAGKILQAFSWRDGKGNQRRMRLCFEDGLQLHASFGAVRDGQQTIGSFRMKWSLIARKEPA